MAFSPVTVKYERNLRIREHAWNEYWRNLCGRHPVIVIRVDTGVIAWSLVTKFHLIFHLMKFLDNRAIILPRSLETFF